MAIRRPAPCRMQTSTSQSSNLALAGHFLVAASIFCFIVDNTRPRLSSSTAVQSESAVKCQFCTSTTFRRSKLREGDMAYLASLKYPVRCVRCNLREFVPLLSALFARSSRSHTLGRPLGSTESWKAWTSGTLPHGGGYELAPQAKQTSTVDGEAPANSL